MKSQKRIIKTTLIVLCVLALLVVCALAYAYFNGRSGIRHNPEAAENDIRIACVGDSITYGSQVSNWPQNHYPLLLNNLLGNGFTVHNYGVSGAALLHTADKPYANTGVYSDSITFAPDIVIIMLGTNDTKTRNWTNAEDFRTQLTELLSVYSALPSAPDIYLCTPCKAYSDKFTIQDECIETVAQVVQDVATELELPLVDIRSLSVQHPEWFIKDGIHPNNDGARAIAQAIADAIVLSSEGE